MVRLPDGTRSPYCGKHCQNSAGASSPVESPISPQSYRPGSYPTMTSPQSNHPNPPIGMSPHQQLLPGGSARPEWVMTTIPFCRYCRSKPCWNDPVKQLYSAYCSRRCKEAAERAPRAVSSLNGALPQQNYSVPPISSTLPPQYPLYQPQQPPLPQRNASSSTNYSSPNEDSSQRQMNRRPKANVSPRQDDDSQQQQASDGPSNPTSSVHHFRYPNTDTPISHRDNSQSPDGQAPPPIPTNKPTQTRPQQINSMPINTSQPVQTSPPSQQSTEIPSSSQVQAQEQNQPHSPTSSQPQVPTDSRPQSQPDELHPQDTYVITPYVFNPNIDDPPPYTPNEAFTGNIAPDEDISIRKVTRDDNFDEENPYGFRDVNNNNSDEQEQNNNQSNNNQEQRTQRIRWRR